jgi:hypothetical protein
MYVGIGVRRSDLYAVNTRLIFADPRFNVIGECLIVGIVVDGYRVYLGDC